MKTRHKPFGYAIRRLLRVGVLATATIVAVVFVVLALRPVPEGTPTVVAKKDIEVGDTVTSSDLRVIPLPAEAIPAVAVGSVEKVAGLVSLRPIPAGTVVTTEMMEGSDQSHTIPSGFAQTVLALDPATVFVSAGDAIEVWGIPEVCPNDTCRTEQLAGNATVVQVLPPEETTFCGEQALVTLLLQADNVGSVLSAAKAGTVHFVLRESEG